MQDIGAGPKLDVGSFCPTKGSGLNSYKEFFVGRGGRAGSKKVVCARMAWKAPRWYW